MATTREHILAAARRALADAQAPPTMAQLALHAGLSRATLHRHFPARHALLRAVDVLPPQEACT